MADFVQDPGSLDNLHDLVVPRPVAWWPPASGWYVFIAVLATVVVLISLRAGRKWWRNRYRREALTEIARIQSGLENEPLVATIVALDEVLKRVALAAWPRAHVAQLSGQRWLDFLHTTSTAGVFTREDAALLDTVYSSKARERLTSPQVRTLLSDATTWIRTHVRNDQVQQHVEEASSC